MPFMSCFLHQATWQQLTIEHQAAQLPEESFNQSLFHPAISTPKGPQEAAALNMKELYRLMQAGIEWPQLLDIQIKSFNIWATSQPHANRIRLHPSSCMSFLCNSYACRMLSVSPGVQLKQVDTPDFQSPFSHHFKSEWTLKILKYT